MRHLVFALAIMMLPMSMMAQQRTKAKPAAKKVYVCTSGNSTKYHKTKDCRMLKTCNGEVKLVTQGQAHKMKRTQCGVCYKRTKKRAEKSKE